MKKSGFKLYFCLIFSLSLTSCSEQNFPEPSCRVNANFSSDRTGAAACVVVLNKKLLAIQLKDKSYGLAISNADSNSAQCNAHSAMWLETGLNVEVGPVLAIQKDGTWLFSCETSAGFDGTESPFPAPEWSAKETENLAFIDPFLIRIEDWHIPEHFITSRDAYVLEVSRKENEKD